MLSTCADNFSYSGIRSIFKNGLWSTVCFGRGCGKVAPNKTLHYWVSLSLRWCLLEFWDGRLLGLLGQPCGMCPRPKHHRPIQRPRHLHDSHGHRHFCQARSCDLPLCCLYERHGRSQRCSWAHLFIFIIDHLLNMGHTSLPRRVFQFRHCFTLPSITRPCESVHAE